MAHALSVATALVAAALTCGCYDYQYLSRNLPDGSATTDLTSLSRDAQPPSCPVSLGNQPFAALDFESALVGWGSQTVSELKQVEDAESAHCGQQGYHLQTAALNADSAARIKRQFLGSSDGDLYIRAYLWPKLIQSPKYVEMITIYDPMKGNGVALIGSSPGMVGLLSGLSGADVYTAEIPFPQGRWVCLEWHLALTRNGTMLPVDLSIDGGVVLADTFSIADTEAVSFSENQIVALGLYAPTTASAELYMDDVVISRTPVGCQ
jgi:hypothetical protein